MSGSEARDSAEGVTVADLEADIRRDRQELGQTVEALSAKLDVKAQLKSSTDQARDRASRLLSAHWRELVVVAVYAASVTIVWKKLP